VEAAELNRDYAGRRGTVARHHPRAGKQVTLSLGKRKKAANGGLLNQSALGRVIGPRHRPPTRGWRGM
jgi:hypothetical protein